MNRGITESLSNRLVLVLLLGGLLLLTYAVLAPFLVPVIWAVILAYVTWPLLERKSIRPVMHRVLPAAQAAEAHREMEAGQHIGKLVLSWRGD